MVAMTPQIQINTVMIRAARTCRLKVDSRKIRRDTASFEQVRAMTERISLAKAAWLG